MRKALNYYFTVRDIFHHFPFYFFGKPESKIAFYAVVMFHNQFIMNIGAVYVVDFFSAHRPAFHIYKTVYDIVRILQRYIGSNVFSLLPEVFCKTCHDLVLLRLQFIGMKFQHSFGKSAEDGKIFVFRFAQYVHRSRYKIYRSPEFPIRRSFLYW